MSIATSIFLKALYGVAADAAIRAAQNAKAPVLRGLATAMLAGAAVGPVMAESYDQNLAPGQETATAAPGATGGALLNEGPTVLGGVKQIGKGVGDVFSGFGRFIANGATGASGAKPFSADPVVAQPGMVVSVQAPLPHAVPGQLGAPQREAYEKLALTAAAHRLVTEAAFDTFAGAREQNALLPRNIGLARQLITARQNLDREVAALNVAVIEFDNATKVLSKRYPQTNFNQYKALAASLGAPVEMRSNAVASNQPIYAAAEALAIQIMAGEVPRATAMTAGTNATNAMRPEASMRRLAYNPK